MKLLYKFFLAFFVSSLAIVILLLVLIATNLSSGFNDFVGEAENKHIESTKQQLISIYQRYGSWQSIIRNEQIWRDIVNPQSGRRPPPPNNRPPRNEGHKPRIDDNHRQFVPRDNIGGSLANFLETGRRLSLYDANKNAIVGRNDLAEHPRIEAITLNGNIIGWLGLMPASDIIDSPASDFLVKQYENYYYVGIAAIALAFIMAFFISKQLVAPINDIVNGTNKLIAGNYHTRIRKNTNDELGFLMSNFNNLAHTLEKNQKNRFQWMSDTSHELRTPLTVVKSQLIAIQDGIFKADEKRIKLLIDEIDNLSHIVDDLYQLSSSDAGALTYKKSSLNPIELLKKEVDNFQPKFKQHLLKCNYAGLEHLQCLMLADKDRLKQLFTNLLENSCRYTYAGGEINIQALISNKQLELQIQDSAPGVALDVQSKLFERFYRVEKSRTRSQGGSGLGLSLCKQIVEAHQGSIVAMDSPLGGLSMKITFPIQ